jgi:tRNA(Arg) A34 adenosine deaminase TadA
MRLALAEAEASPLLGDVPVGAIVLRAGEVVAKAHNEREFRSDPTAHAEILAIRAASEALGRSELGDCALVVTLEPCVMCAGAMLVAGVGRVVFAAFDPKAGACGSRYNLLADPRMGLEIATSAGVLEQEASTQLSAFFASLRGRSAGDLPPQGI